MTDRLTDKREVMPMCQSACAGCTTCWSSSAFYSSLLRLHFVLKKIDSFEKSGVLINVSHRTKMKLSVFSVQM